MGLIGKLLEKFNLSWGGSYEDYYNASTEDTVECEDPNPFAGEAQDQYTNMRLKEEQWLEAHYDFNSAEGISAIPVSADLPRLNSGGDGIRSYTGDVDYYLRRKGFEYEKADNIDLAILCLKKSNAIRMAARKGYSRDDYYSLVRMLARTGRIDDAKAEKRRIDDLFAENPGWDNDSGLLTPQNMVKCVIDSASLLHTDLVIMSVHGSTCPECAKFEGRVFSLSGADRRFPKIPDAFWRYGAIHPGCGHTFHPYIHGVTRPDLEYTLRVHRGVKRKYTKNIIAYSNRPFLDDRPKEDIDTALALAAKFREETERRKYNWDHMIEYEAAKYADLQKLKWLQENLPHICPKSLSGYRRMRTQNTKNYQKIVAAAKAMGFDL